MKTKMRIGALDAALLFRADGKVEVFLPRVAPEHAPANVAAAQVLFWAYANREAMSTILSLMDEEFVPRSGVS